MDAAPRIFQIKLLLEHLKPPCFRRIQIPENYTFLELHRAITRILFRKDMNHKWRGVEIGTWPGVSETIDEKTVVLNRYFHEPEDSMDYEYSVTASKQRKLKLELELVLPAVNGKEYPVFCVGGINPCAREILPEEEESE